MPYGMLDHLHAFLRDPLLATSESLGLPADHLLMALLALAAVPIGLIHSFIPIRFATFRHIYASVTGTLWAWLLLGPEFLHVLACAFGALAILRISNPNSAPIWVTAFTIGYMTIVHLRRIWFDYLGWRLDSTTAMMITVVKLNMFAWAYCDGKLVQMGKKLHKKESIHEELVKKSISKLPSLLEFYSFVMYYGSVLVGPPFGIKHYLTFQDGSIFKNSGFQGTPSTIMPTLKAFVRVLICVPIYLYSSNFPVFGYIGSEGFLALSKVHQMLYIWFAVAIQRFKYYFAWYLIEEANIASGLGFNSNSKVGAVKWDAVNNCNVLRTEFNTNIIDVINNWNKGVNDWLKYDVYVRVSTPKFLEKIFGNKMLPMLVTRIFSSLWHGFYGGYYLFFLSVVFLNMGDAALQRILENKNGLFHNFLRWSFISFILTYMGSSFMLLEASTTWTSWKSTYFAGHILALVPVILENLVKPSRKIHRANRKDVQDVPKKED